MRSRFARMWLIIAAAIIGVATLSGAYAASQLEQVSAYVNKGINIVIRGEQWHPQDEQGNALYPLVYEGRTYVPLRALEEDVFNYEVDWDAATSTITVDRGVHEDAVAG